MNVTADEPQVSQAKSLAPGLRSSITVVPR